ncbi:hypothetical protein EPD60_03165 [Flaviaesturariibacter flavus]|uniref:Uncharacterized protein n=1 Tax=Flaviaesturariibacter flavus TaxID=2502780 RepID=A0A4R1BMU2_9BACT|nr:hypothetical protein [Flaviaesturariibacter flavus]TCJ18774.1 hypothetical protein EPD60_03165 [Flaviaesturariibacter flavus]
MVMKQREPKENKEQGRQRPANETRGKGLDFWDRVARDVAGGYGAQRTRGGSVLNEDQRADDARRGDA